jgi:hypothetical protein
MASLIVADSAYGAHIMIVMEYLPVGEQATRQTEGLRGITNSGGNCEIYRRHRMFIAAKEHI